MERRGAAAGRRRPPNVEPAGHHRRPTPFRATSAVFGPFLAQQNVRPIDTTSLNRLDFPAFPSVSRTAAANGFEEKTRWLSDYLNVSAQLADVDRSVHQVDADDVVVLEPPPRPSQRHQRPFEAHHALQQTVQKATDCPRTDKEVIDKISCHCSCLNFGVLEYLSKIQNSKIEWDNRPRVERRAESRAHLLRGGRQWRPAGPGRRWRQRWPANASSRSAARAAG